MTDLLLGLVLTLPLVPVFMVLIGRYTEDRTREQWGALRHLSTHFLDVVQGLLETAGVRDFYDSTNYRRLQQLIAYAEKSLGRDRNELLDGLTGDGIVVAAKLGKLSDDERALLTELARTGQL